MKNIRLLLLAFVATAVVAFPARAKVLVYEGFHTSDYGLKDTSGGDLGGKGVTGKYTVGIKTPNANWTCSSNSVDFKVVGYNYGLPLPDVMTNAGFSVVGGAVETDHDKNSAEIRSAYHSLVANTFNVSSGKLYFRMIVRASVGFTDKLAPGANFSNSGCSYAGFGFCVSAAQEHYLLTRGNSSFFFAVSKDASGTPVLSLCIRDTGGTLHTYTLDSDITPASPSVPYICYAEVSLNAGSGGAERIRAGAMKITDFTGTPIWATLSGSSDTVEVNFITASSYPDCMAITGPRGTNGGYFRADEIVVSTTLGEILNFAIENIGTPTVGQTSFTAKWKLIAAAGTPVSAQLVLGTDESLASATTTSLGNNLSAGTYTVEATGLTPATTNWWKIVANNGAEEVETPVSSICTRYSGDIYVSSGNAGASLPYGTWGTAAANIADAVAIADDGTTIHVAPGLYKISTPIVISKAISVMGDSPDPSRVVVSNTFNVNWDNQNKRVFSINNADALVANLTMQKGQFYYSGHGGNFYIGSSGGTVSNCVIEAGATAGNAQAAGACLDGGLVTHSIFRKNKSSSGTAHWDGKWKGLLYLKGSSRAENCLFAENSHTVPVVLIGLAGTSSMRNCTIARTRLEATNEYCNVFAVINVESQTATLQNVVVAGVTNAIDGAPCRIIGYTARFLSGAYDGAATGLPAGTVIGTADEFFKDYAGRDYRPKTAGPLVNKGESYEGMAATDLGGNRRFIGSKVDIGCYEGNIAGTYIHLR